MQKRNFANGYPNENRGEAYQSERIYENDRAEREMHASMERPVQNSQPIPADAQKPLERIPCEKKEHRKRHFWRNYFIISGIVFNAAVLVLLAVRLLVYINTFMPKK